MTSIILQTATRLLTPLMLLYSLVLVARGHDHPGGGFVGGLTAASALVLRAFAEGVPSARRALRVDPRGLAGAGLCLALAAASLPLALGLPLMTGLWGDVPLPGRAALEVGTPLLFDLGVYLVVSGSVLAFTFALLEDAP